LKDGEACVLGKLLLLVLRGVRVGEMLEEPRTEDVCGHFGEDSSLLLVLLASIVILLPCPFSTPDAGITCVAGIRVGG
jgi:hypothetical protein